MTPDVLPRFDFAGDLTGYTGGTGPDLLLVHGVGLRVEAWGAMLPLLEQQFTVTALDMPGHGGSAQIAGNGLRAFSDRFAEFLTTRAGPVCVAGHSMGAMIALDLACRYPEKVDAVAALNAIYQRPSAAANVAKARAAALSHKQVFDPSPTVTRWFGPNPAGDDAVAAASCQSWLTSCDPKGYADAYRVFAHHPGPKNLHTLHCPALFLTAEHDANSTPEMSQEMAGLCPNGQAIIVKDAAHMAPMTHTDMIARHLILFFNPKGQFS